MKLRALDLFCGAGGATRGLQMAGYEVTGVDVRPMSRYVGEHFIRDDAMAWLRGEREPLESFDLVWASPPCEHYSELVPPAYRGNHPDLLTKTLDALRALDVSYIVENVAGARRFFRGPVVLCGSMFGLPIQRHRWFEIGNCDVFFLLPSCNHSEPPVLVSGRGMRQVGGRRRKEDTKATKAAAIDIDWMNLEELEDAIPPAYSRFLAEQIRAVMEAGCVAEHI
jgi:DNA (cytosine-5)-methyltransferase 1